MNSKNRPRTETAQIIQLNQAAPKAFACPPQTTPGGAEGLAEFRAMDRTAKAALAQLTSGLSPVSAGLAFADWSAHLADSPGKQIELAVKALQKVSRFGKHVLNSIQDPTAPGCIEALSGDDRFSDPAWQQLPYRLWSQAFLLNQQWWHNATHDVPGVSKHHQDMVSFAVRQWLDMVSPSNVPWMNPAVLQKTIHSHGQNLMQGVMNWWEDWYREATKQKPVGTEDFVVGKDVAATPGKVIYRNHLMELIQYSPMGEKVFAEPVLIVPAWIMKYYILDLSAHNSLVRFLVTHGHTVFCISWRNVTAQDRNLSLEDYRKMGVMAALDAINAIVPNRPIHAAGYCLGGTLLAIAAAAMAEFSDNRLASVSLFAAQTDFTEPGELQLFIDEGQVNFLESMMWERGTLETTQMAGAFQMLRSNDLIWSRIIHEYMMGERAPMNDLMAWNADRTRLPYQMHSDYLRKLFLNNDLASGRYMVDGRSISLQNVHLPIFAVGTDRDHVAPWRSVYKIHHLTDTDVTFVLTSGGHNAGIVSEPRHQGRHFKIMQKATTDHTLNADEWSEQAPEQEGSWWISWQQWLQRLSSAALVPPPTLGTAQAPYQPVGEAPGTYVLQA